MKIKELTLNNFAKYDSVTVSFDPNVNYLIGKNGSGKSTIGITGVQAIFQGIAEKAMNGTNPVFGERFRFIGPKAATSKNEMILVDEKNGNAEIKVLRKITKSGSELSFEAPESYGTLDQDWLNNLFNIFLIAPKQFTDLNSKEQSVALGIDTSKYDKPIAALKTDYTSINAVYRSFGELEVVEEVEKANLEALQAEKKAIEAKMKETYLANKELNKEAQKERDAACALVDTNCEIFNKAQYNLNIKLNALTEALNILKDNGYEGTEVFEFIKSLGEVQEAKVAKDLYPIPLVNMEENPDHVPKEGEKLLIKELPDRTELEAIDLKIAEAGKTNEKHLLYTQYLEKKTAKELKAKELADNKQKQIDKENERINYIKAFKFPFSNLTVGEDGGLLLNSKPLKEPYFSTGELLKVIPILIANQNPELKYVFIQNFGDLDEDNQAQVEKYLLEKGFQLVIEVVGKEKINDKNCILLKDNVIVESYEYEGNILS